MTGHLSRRAVSQLAACGALGTVLSGLHSSPAFAASGDSAIYIFLAFSNPPVGDAAAYDRWNTDARLYGMASAPGFMSAQRFAYSDLQLRSTALRASRDLVVYVLKSNDPAATISLIKQRTQADRGLSVASFDEMTIVAYRLFRPEMKGVGGEPADAAAGVQSSYDMVVFQDAVAGQDDAFNAWYDTVHAPELLSVPGFVGAERGELGAVDQTASKPWPRYLNLFKMTTRDLSAVYKLALQGGKPSPALDRATSFGFTYTALGPIVAAPR